MSTDLALLRRFEPVMRYTRGERFFPIGVEPYVRAASLWVQPPGGAALCLVPHGELTLDVLAGRHPAEFGSVHFLNATADAGAKHLAALALKERRRHKEPEEIFHAGAGRLARVGYTSRAVDVLFSLSLIARGRVPGDLASMAAESYREVMREGEEYRYHGRVVRQGSWTVLQYWFFYYYNDWRSQFHGTNDHEADWEMICVFLDRSNEDDATPEWVAYACHDYSGDDLRRRWEDPEVETVDGHPVVYAGAGSHAAYYRPGDYLTQIELPVVKPAARVMRALGKLWHDTLRQYELKQEDDDDGVASIFRVPFVDYARGDGRTIGPSGHHAWDEPVLIGPTPGWIGRYKGLWGHYVRDPFAGEDAPAGPMYNRDGTVRRSWYDPVGWCGLDKVSPRGAALTHTIARRDDIEARQQERRGEIERKNEELINLGVEAAAMRDHPYLKGRYERCAGRIAELSEEIDEVRSQIAADDGLLVTLSEQAAALEAGDPAGRLRAHIRRHVTPLSQERLRFGRLAEAWAAASVGLTMIGLFALLWFAPRYIGVGMAWMFILLVVIEAAFRDKLTGLVTAVTVTLALVATGVLLYEFWRYGLLLLLLVVGTYMLWQNLRELWR